MLDTLLFAALVAVTDPPATPEPTDLPVPAQDSGEQPSAEQTDPTSDDARTKRDLLAVAEHVLRNEGFDETTLPRNLFPALVAREAEARLLRTRLADLQVQLASLEARMAEMQDFVLDHDRYGTDFSQYRSVRHLAEQEARRKAALERKARRDLARKQAQDAKAQRDTAAQIASPGKDMQTTLRDQNFGLIGQDVWSGRSAYAYAKIDRPGETITWNPSPFGGTRVTTESRTEIDWSVMTISGSVVNAAADTRNIGIAFAFFDEYGNQVGAETVVVNNARTGVPYPFTQKLAMAATKPFASSTSWVLFSDPITPPAQAQGTTPTTTP